MKTDHRTTILAGVAVAMLVICPIITGGVAYVVLSQPSIHSALKGFMDTLDDMVSLQQKVAAQYQAEAVQVSIQNGTTLRVSLINSPFNDLEVSKQRMKAEEIARFVAGNYRGISAINEVHITFVKHGEAFGISADLAKTYAFRTANLR